MSRLIMDAIRSKTYPFFTLLTGVIHTIIGSLAAYPILHWERLVLIVIDVFVAQEIIMHLTRDMMRGALRKTLKMLVPVGSIINALITAYLTYLAGWLVVVFVALCVILLFYGMTFKEIMFGLAGIFAVLGSYYIQTGTIKFASVFLSIFAMWQWWGGIHLYRIDYWMEKGLDPIAERNESLIMMSMGIPPLIISIILLFSK